MVNTTHIFAFGDVQKLFKQNLIVFLYLISLDCLVEFMGPYTEIVKL